VSVELTEENHRALYVPERFAHGYQVLVDNTETSYQVGEFYSPPNERALRYDDPHLGLSWPLPVTIVSDKDKVAPLLDTWGDRLKQEMTLK
jgi:dTDP-4-dehydrorhamnose 3,5-epimerase